MLRDRIQKQVYPQRHNTATILNYLEELVLINAKEVGLVPIDQDQNGYQDVAVPFGEVVSLEVPEGAVSATIMVEQGRTDEDNETDPDESESIIASISAKKERLISADGVAQLLQTDSSAVVRFKENGASPSINSGFGLGNQDIFELVGEKNLRKFKVVGIQENATPVLRIQFYKTAQLG